jgi:hypothetical protein
MDQAIQSAKSARVKLFTVGLSDGVDSGVLSQMAKETGGAYIFSDDASQLVSAYGNLGDLLSGTGQVYRLFWKAVGSKDFFSVNGWFSASMRVKLENGNPLYLQFRVDK